MSPVTTPDLEGQLAHALSLAEVGVDDAALAAMRRLESLLLSGHAAFPRLAPHARHG